MGGFANKKDLILARVRISHILYNPWILLLLTRIGVVVVYINT